MAMLIGTTTTNAATGTVSFEAHARYGPGEPEMISERYDLRVSSQDDGDTGYYDATDADGRSWLLIDYEDHAELYPA